jgi:hypothetical protein
MEVVPDRESRRCSRSGGGTGLGGSRPGGPTRRRERWSDQNRSGRGDRNDRGRPHRPGRWRTSPAWSSSPEPGVNAVRRSGVRTQRVRPLPRSRGGPQSPSLRTRRKSRGRAGSWRVRVLVVERIGKQTSDERIGGCLSGGASQGVTSREVPSPTEADTWWEDSLTTRVGGDRAKTVRRSSAVANLGFRERVGLVGCEACEGRDFETRSNHGVRRLGLYALRP